MPDNDPYLVPLNAASSAPSREAPLDKIRRIARSDNLPDDIAEDFGKVTGLESGRSHYSRTGQVKVSPIDPKDGQRAIGFSQIKPSTARSVGIDNPYDEESNIKAGLRYYAQGGADPVRRRIAYFSGQNSRAVKFYDRTGKIPSGGDFTGTSFSQYISGTGGQQQPSDPYLVPLKPSDPNLVELSQPTPQQPVSQKPARTSSLIPGITQLRQIANPKVRARAKVQPQIQVGGELGQPSEATQTKGGLRGLAQMAGAPTGYMGDAGDWINESVYEGTAPILRSAAGIVQQMPHDPFEKNQVLQDAATSLKQAAGTVETKTPILRGERGRASQFGQELIAGGIGSSPAMILSSLGVPAPLAFGLQSELEASGRDADFKGIVKDTAKGATIGALFELPLPAKQELLTVLQQRLLRAGIVGAGTAAITGSPQESIVNAAFGGLGKTEGREVSSESLTQVPDIESRLAQREGSPYLQPQDVARRIALREQGTVPPATLPEVPDAVRNMTSQPIGPRRLPTPRGTERPVVPSENLSEQVGVGIQPDTGDIAVANAKITALQRRIQETQAVKQPSPRITAMQERLQQQLADATHERNLLLDPKLQAQLENKPIRQVFAERKVNAQTEPTRLATGVITEANTPQGRPSLKAGQGETTTNMAAQIGQQGTSGDITGRRIQEPQATESGTQEGNVRSEAPRHVDLQARVKRGPNAGDFRKETKAETEARRAQVSQPAAEVTPSSASESPVAVNPESLTSPQGQPASFKGSPDRLMTDLKNGGDVSQAMASGKQLFSDLDVPSQRVVMKEMLTAIHDPQVRERVVQFIPVDVVNRLASLEPSTQVSLHDQSVLKSVFATNLKGAVSMRSDMANRLGREIAQMSTESPSALATSPLNLGTASETSIVKRHVASPSSVSNVSGVPESISGTPSILSQSPTPTAETIGIAHRVETQARGSEPVRGESIGAEESVQRGRDLLSKSPDPGRLVAQTVTAFDKTGAVSPESMAIIRAQHEQLAQQANRAFDAGGINSPEFKAAEQARRDFYDNAVKPMQTAWSNTGRAQQGETAIDTGTFYGLYRAFRDTNGREMNPREQLTAKKLSDTSAAADLRVSDTQKRLVDTLNKICPP